MDVLKKLGSAVKGIAPTLGSVLLNAVPGGPVARAAVAAIAGAVGSGSDDPDVVLSTLAVSDPAQAAAVRAADQQFELELRRIDLQRDLGQVEVNKVEAAHKSLFVSGWRPGTGWICNAALAYAFLLQPALTDAARVYLGVEFTAVDPGALLALLGALLGVGIQRSYEKGRGVARER